ncbi:unnamed protein product [Ixodes pacificus]
MAAGTVWDVVALSTSGREKLEEKKTTKTAIVTPSKVYSMSCACLRGETPNPDVLTDSNVRRTPFFLSKFQNALHYANKRKTVISSLIFSMRLPRWFLIVWHSCDCRIPA